MMKYLFLLFSLCFSLNANAVISEIFDYIFDKSNCNTFSHKRVGKDHIIINNWDIAEGNYDCLFKTIKPFKSMTIGVGNGGHLFETHRIADEIKKRQISVGVHKSCVSACTFIAAASDTLKMCSYTQIGIHHYGRNGKTEKDPEISDYHYRKMLSYGIALKPYKNIFEQTPHEKLYDVSFKELQEIGFNPKISKNCN